MALLRALTRRATSLRPFNTATSSTLRLTPSHITPESLENDTNITVDDSAGNLSLLRSLFHSHAPPSNSISSLADILKGMREPRLNLDSVLPPPPTAPNLKVFTVEEARKLLRVAQAARLRTALREIPTNTISYSEYVQMCIEKCGNNEEQGLEFAKLMDQSGDVIVISNVVFTRPEKVVEKMADFITHSIATPNDPRRKEFEQMEKQKAMIDKKACSLVRRELYCGLGLMVMQTLGFMRLTFWELSWDVMEPICFFVTSLHFAAGYVFFLRTSTEPSFEGFYKRRFKVKQRKLMEVEGFDLDKYNEMCMMFRQSFKGDFAGLVE